jgi:hypothetical protein
VKIKLILEPPWPRAVVDDEEAIKRELARFVPAEDVDLFFNSYLDLLEADTSIVEILYLQHYNEATEFLKDITAVVSDSKEVPLREMLEEELD